MFGIVIGTLCLLGLVAMVRRHRYQHCGPGYHRGWGGRRGWASYGGGSGRGYHWLRGLSARLGASAEQERVISAEVEDFFEQARGMRREAMDTRSDVAKAMKGDSFDEEVMGEAFARHDDKLSELRKGLVGALARIHDVLDPRQRERLAGLLESGPGFGGFRPYRM